MSFCLARRHPKAAAPTAVAKQSLLSGYRSDEVRKTYAEKLKDPRWLEKRTDVLNEHGLFCEKCGEAGVELHVHHNSYFKNREPWQYQNNQFSVLCDCCHQDYHDSFDPLLYVISMIGVDSRETRTVIAVLIAGYLNIEDKKIIDHVENTEKGWFGYGKYYLDGESIRMANSIISISEKHLKRLQLLIQRLKKNLLAEEIKN